MAVNNPAHLHAPSGANGEISANTFQNSICKTVVGVAAGTPITYDFTSVTDRQGAVSPPAGQTGITGQSAAVVAPAKNMDHGMQYGLVKNIGSKRVWYRPSKVTASPPAADNGALAGSTSPAANTDFPIDPGGVDPIRAPFHFVTAIDDAGAGATWGLSITAWW